jgi:hypothetical protein
MGKDAPVSQTKSFRPFSNGTEYQIWDEINCCQCAKGWMMLQTDGTYKNYADSDYESDLMCKLQDDLTIGTFTGTIPYETAEQIGINGHGLVGRCRQKEARNAQS